MGFGIGVGPRIMRVRVSTRGVGISSGVGPFSVWASTGPRRRRNHVRVRTGSVRYLAEPTPQAAPIVPVHMDDVTGFDAHLLQSTGAGDLVFQLNNAARRQWWPWLSGITGVFALATLDTWWLALLILLGGSLLTAPVFRAERLRSRVEVDYDVAGPIAEWFTAVSSGWSALQRLGGAWRITTSGDVRTTYQHKTNAGASAIVGRTALRFPVSAPSILITNVAVPAITSVNQSLLLLPDRVLVRSGRRWSDVAYEQLDIAAHSQSFIEDGRLPRDSQRIGTTWQYVNVKGGPDRRYKNNRQLAVMLYGRIALTTTSGLQWIIDLSQPNVATWLADLLTARPSTSRIG